MFACVQHVSKVSFKKRKGRHKGTFVFALNGVNEVSFPRKFTIAQSAVNKVRFLWRELN